MRYWEKDSIKEMLNRPIDYNVVYHLTDSVFVRMKQQKIYECEKAFVYRAIFGYYPFLDIPDLTLRGFGI